MTMSKTVTKPFCPKYKFDNKYYHMVIAFFTLEPKIFVTNNVINFTFQNPAKPPPPKVKKLHKTSTTATVSTPSSAGDHLDETSDQWIEERQTDRMEELQEHSDTSPPATTTQSGSKPPKSSLR